MRQSKCNIHSSRFIAMAGREEERARWRTEASIKDESLSTPDSGKKREIAKTEHLSMDELCSSYYNHITNMISDAGALNWEWIPAC